MATSMFKAIICWWQVCPLAHVSLQKTKIDLQGHAGAPGLGRSSVTFSKGSAHPPQDQCTCDDAKQCFGTISLTSHFFFCCYCIFYVNFFAFIGYVCTCMHSPTTMQLAAIIPGITIGSLAHNVRSLCGCWWSRVRLITGISSISLCIRKQLLQQLGYWLLVLSKRVNVMIPTPAMTAHKVRCCLVILILEHCIVISRSFDFLQTAFNLLLTCVVVMAVSTGQTDCVVWVVTAASSALSGTLTLVFGGYAD